MNEKCAGEDINNDEEYKPTRIFLRKAIWFIVLSLLFSLNVSIIYLYMNM